MFALSALGFIEFKNFSTIDAILLGQIIDGKMNARKFATRNLQVTRSTGSAAKNDCIVSSQQIFRRNILADTNVILEFDSRGLHQFYTTFNDRFRKTEVRDAVAHKSADMFCRFVDSHIDSCTVQVFCTGKSRRARTNHRNSFIGTNQRDVRTNPTVFVTRFDHAVFNFAVSHRITVLTVHARTFAKSRANNSRKFRERTRVEQKVQGFVPLSTAHGMVDFGNYVRQRATVIMAERNATVHAAERLFHHLSLGHFLGGLFVIVNTFFNGTFFRITARNRKERFC